MSPAGAASEAASSGPCGISASAASVAADSAAAIRALGAVLVEGGYNSFSGAGGGFGGGGGESTYAGGRGGRGGFGGGPGGSVGGYGTPSIKGFGGGGLGAGADVFVQNGGILTIQGSATLGAGTVSGGTGIDSDKAGAGLGSGLFLQGNQQSVILAPGAGQTLTVNGVIARPVRIAEPTRRRPGHRAGSASLAIGAGTVVLAPVTAPGGSTATANTYTGGTTIAGGGILQLAGPGAAGTGAIGFASLSGTATARLTLTQSAQPFVRRHLHEHARQFRHRQPARAPGPRQRSGQLQRDQQPDHRDRPALRRPGQPDLRSVQSELDQLPRQSNGQGGTLIAVCFVTGARIRTTRGEVAVQDLQVGDRAVTASGIVRSVTWIGHRPIDGPARPCPTPSSRSASAPVPSGQGCPPGISASRPVILSSSVPMRTARAAISCR